MLALALALVGTAGALAAFRLHDPPVAPPPAREWRLCGDPDRADAARRPDGTLPPSCAPTAADGAMTLLFAGDTAIADHALPLVESEGFDYPFAATAPLAREADVAIANAEAPFVVGERRSLLKQYAYRSPPDAAAAIARAGFDVIGLANNHAYDYGAKGLLDTLATAQRAQLFSVGAGADEASARRGLLIRGRGVSIGLIARCVWKPDWDLWVGQYARGGSAGVALLDEERLRADVARLRAQGADLVFLFVHWGDDYAPPTDAQRREAEQAAAAGVDLVVGHHPHVAQPLLRARVGAPVALSLGNYAFGTWGRDDLEYGLLLRVEVRAKRIARLELRPIDVQNRRVQFRPAPLDAVRARAALARLVEESNAQGAKLRVEGDRAVWDPADR